MKTRQLIYSKKKAEHARLSILTKFFCSIMALIAIAAVASVFLEPESAQASVGILTGTSFASMAVIGNIKDVPDIDVSGSAIAYKVYLVELSQLDENAQFPKANASREVTTIPLADGEYMHYFEAHDIPTFGSTGEKGDLTIDPTNTFTMIMGGNHDQLLNFIEQHVGGKFIIIFQECESPNKYIIGNPCKPMILKSYELKNDKDSRSVTFTFENKTIQQPKKYVGDIVTKAPATHTQVATALAVQAGVNTYKIPGGSSATYAIATVSGITASDKGRVITLEGTGTENAATIADNTTFILEDGATWTANTGSRISFRRLDATTLVEVQGTRVQTA